MGRLHGSELDVGLEFRVWQLLGFQHRLLLGKRRRSSPGNEANRRGSLNPASIRISGTAPGTLVGSLGTIADASLGPQRPTTIFPSLTLLLSPLRYWVGISSVDDSSAAWSMAKDISGAGVLNEYYGDTADGYYANNYSGYPYAFRMDVAGADAPEPSTILLGAFGLALLAAYRRRPSLSYILGFSSRHELAVRPNFLFASRLVRGFTFATASGLSQSPLMR